MSKEPKWNINHSCVHHHEAVLEEYQKETNNFYLKDDFVKTAFLMDDDTVEHMWVKVIDVNQEQNSLTGYLWNDPLSPSEKFQLYSRVSVDFNKISSLIKNDKSNLN